MKKLWRLFVLVLFISAFIFGGGSESPHIVIKTELGDIKVEIYEKDAPITASNFLKYVDEDRAIRCIGCKAKDALPDRILWYDKPAAYFEEALPLGNGRIGAMVYGTVPSEHILLNEETLWAGGDRWILI